MVDFCRHALAYMTGEPLAAFEKKKARELTPLLLSQLQERTWLIVLDGLERVLVAYNRIDAAQLRDEEAGERDVIADRDPCAAIRPEDDDLLRLLTTAVNSKLLLTSRLVPRVLLNSASQPIPGVLRVALPGLRPADAEAFFRACGVTGDSRAIQAYLKTNCDCHPLTVGALAGLVTHYLPARNDFDRWVADPSGGARLNLGELDLVQKRNHILRASIETLQPASLNVLSIIAMLSQSVDYETLEAIALAPVAHGSRPPSQRIKSLNAQRQRDERAARVQVSETERRSLVAAIGDLERRGLLQYDAQAQHYDLHPVVRAFVSRGLASDEKETLGQRVVDYFSSRPHSPFEHAETLEDVRDGLHMVRTLIEMGKLQRAVDMYKGALAHSLLFNLEASAELVALVRPFFSEGWGKLPTGVDKASAGVLGSHLSVAFSALGLTKEQFTVQTNVLLLNIENRDWPNLCTQLLNLSVLYRDVSRLATMSLCAGLALEVATLIDDPASLFVSRLNYFEGLAVRGSWREAEAIWALLESMGRAWKRHLYREGEAEALYAHCRFWQGLLQEEDISRAEALAKRGRSRGVERWIKQLRGSWQVQDERNTRQPSRVCMRPLSWRRWSDTGTSIRKLYFYWQN